MTRQSTPMLQRSNARKMRQTMTDAECKLWNQLRAHRLMGFGFRRQMPLGKYIVDFACPQFKVIIEVDGSGHSEPGQIEYDNNRTTFFEENGWHVIRLWNNEVLKNTQDVCAYILAEVKARGAEFSD